MPNGNGTGNGSKKIWIGGGVGLGTAIAIIIFVLKSYCATPADIANLELRASQLYATATDLESTKSDVTKAVDEVKVDIRDLRKEMLNGLDRLGEKIDNREK